MSQTIVTFQTDLQVKKDAEKRAKMMGISLSEFLREALQEKLGNKKTKNPLLELLNILTPEEREDMADGIDNAIKQRHPRDWQKLLKSLE